MARSGRAEAIRVVYRAGWRVAPAVLASAAVWFAQNARGQTPAPAGWTLTWQDEFSGTSLDTTKWTAESTNSPANNERQAYRPGQITVSGGNMVITSQNTPTGGKAYVSGRARSNYAQRHGRWEVRADLPTSKGMWPAIWLLPDVTQYAWASQGEIDIMENRGHQQNLTSSAFHYRQYPNNQFRASEQTTAQFATAENYHTGFHTYAVEWDAAKVRFFVDDVNHYTLYGSDIGNFLATQSAPMKTMLNTAVGGDFLGSQQPDGSTVWPQQFLIDYVRIYQKNADPIRFRNGKFEENAGSLAGWSVFGNRVNTNNVSVHNEAAHDAASLKLFGQFNGAANTSGISQGITVAAGDEIRASAESFIRAQDSILGTANSVQMKIEFYNQFGGKRTTSAFLSEVVQTIANGSSPNNAWQPHALMATAPAGAVEARLALVFSQTAANSGGAVHIDNVKFVNLTLNPEGDFDGDGDVDGDDVGAWRENFGTTEGSMADADGDSDVDGDDFLVWQRQLGTPAAAEQASVAVPEPVTSVLLLGGILALRRAH